MNLSQDQSQALEKLFDWIANPKSRFITLGGYAGTGKTTLISILRHKMYNKKKSTKVAFCAFTGKASIVLKNKLEQQDAIYPKDNVSTIHSLIYSAMTNSKGEIIGWTRKEDLKYDLIVVDEASMIDISIWNDLVSYGIPIVAVGDHGQLPPIHGNFNLMDKPEIILTEIHRQARENPIIQLSILARENGEIPIGEYGYNIMKIKRGEPETQEKVYDILGNFNSDTLVLCGYNSTRIKLNKFIRTNLGFETETPEFKDRIICLKNNRKKEIFNGMTGRINLIEVNDKFYYVKILMDDDTIYSGNILAEQFNCSTTLDKNIDKKKEYDLFDFGYAITVHKAQGSQAKRVVLFEERFPKMDDESWRRWLYTAVTRAEEELIIIG